MNETALFLRYENERLAKQQRTRLPVVLIGGFLGAGKTTLLKHILHNRQHLRVAALVNDYAELNIDSDLVRQATTWAPSTATSGRDNVVALSNGCICCSLHQGFRDALYSMTLCGDDETELDYILIETSGVTDPTSVIAALDEKFGKMYRVRLDTVVTVVDSDVIENELSEGREIDAALVQQIACADVVLLNKADLISTNESMSRIRAFVRELQPFAQVHSCKYCAIPLSYVLDVREAEATAAVSHEEISRVLLVSATGGSLRTDASKHATTTYKARKQKEQAGHLQQDAFTSVVFEAPATQLIPLARMQDVLMAELPSTVVRMKGMVRFCENPSLEYTIHLSGRRRFEASPGPITTPGGCSRLVAIYRDSSIDTVKQVLESLTRGSGENDEASTLPAFLEAEQLIATDPRFEALPRERYQAAGADQRVVLFRLTNAAASRLSPFELQQGYGVDFDAMNRKLVRAASAASGGLCFVTSRTIPSLNHAVDGSTEVWIQFGVGGSVPLAHIWPALVSHLPPLLAWFFRNVPQCLCGF